MSSEAASFLQALALDVSDADARRVSDEDMRHVLTAIARLYAQRAEETGDYPSPLDPQATATEVLTLVCEMIRAVDLNMFDLSMWYRRPK